MEKRNLCKRGDSSTVSAVVAAEINPAKFRTSRRGCFHNRVFLCVLSETSKRSEGRTFLTSGGGGSGGLTDRTETQIIIIRKH